MGLFIIIVAAALTASFIKPFVAKALAIGLNIINRELKADTTFSKVGSKMRSSKRPNKPPMPKHKDVQH